MTWFRRDHAPATALSPRTTDGIAAARQAVQDSHSSLESALSARGETLAVTGRLREMRERNHFAETITRSIQRRNHS